MTMLETAVTAITPPLRPHETPPEKSCWCGEPATYVIPGTAYFYCTRHADATHTCYERWTQRGGESVYLTGQGCLPRTLRRRLERRGQEGSHESG